LKAALRRRFFVGELRSRNLDAVSKAAARALHMCREQAAIMLPLLTHPHYGTKK
jgi:hypothetical protein